MPLAVGRGELYPSLIVVHWAVHWCAPGFQGLGGESTGITLLLGIRCCRFGRGRGGGTGGRGVHGITSSHGSGHGDPLQHGPTALETPEDEAI